MGELFNNNNNNMLDETNTVIAWYIECKNLKPKKVNQ